MQRAWLVLILILVTAAAVGQEAAKAPTSRLLTGKLLYVAPMTGGLDGWLMDDLRQWGKYEVTGNAEGVDLVLKSYKPEKDMEWKNNPEGVPVPKDDSSTRRFRTKKASCQRSPLL